MTTVGPDIFNQKTLILENFTSTGEFWSPVNNCNISSFNWTLAIRELQKGGRFKRLTLDLVQGSHTLHSDQRPQTQFTDAGSGSRAALKHTCTHTPSDASPCRVRNPWGRFAGRAPLCSGRAAYVRSSSQERQNHTHAAEAQLENHLNPHGDPLKNLCVCPVFCLYTLPLCQLLVVLVIRVNNIDVSK